MNSTIILTENAGEEWLRVECPYSEDWLKEMKESIPPIRRDPMDGLGWNAEDRVWYFDLSDSDVIEQLIARYFPKPQYSVEWRYE